MSAARDCRVYAVPITGSKRESTAIRCCDVVLYNATQSMKDEGRRKGAEARDDFKTFFFGYRRLYRPYLIVTPETGPAQDRRQVRVYTNRREPVICRTFQTPLLHYLPYGLSRMTLYAKSLTL